MYYSMGATMTTQATPNAQQHYDITEKDLPLHCPMPGMSLWDSHPRVFLPITQSANGQTTCPYCGAAFTLKTAKVA